MKSSKEDLKKRGYIDDIELKEYIDLSCDDLIRLIQSSKSHERTAAVRLLSRNHSVSQSELCDRLLQLLMQERIKHFVM